MEILRPQSTLGFNNLTRSLLCAGVGANSFIKIPAKAMYKTRSENT